MHTSPPLSPDLMGCREGNAIFHDKAKNIRDAMKYTRKNLTTCCKSANRPSTCSHDLLQTCQQVWNKLLTTCNNLVDIVRIVTRLFQQVCYNHDITILLQPCVVNLVRFLLYHDCTRLVRTTCNKTDDAIKLVTSC